MFLLHYEGFNWETFEKDRDYFKILRESGTDLRITYKDKDQFSGLIKFIIWNENVFLGLTFLGKLEWIFIARKDWQKCLVNVLNSWEFFFKTVV